MRGLALLPRPIYDVYRRLFGRVGFDDPRPIAASNPYTYYIPSETHIAAIQAGDAVQLLFRSFPPGRRYEVERMWIRVVSVDHDMLTGTLSSAPVDTPQIRRGARVTAPKSYVIDIVWGEANAHQRLEGPERQVWDRCYVDRCVLDGAVRIDFIFRQASQGMRDGDKFPDSGWRIQGARGDETDEELDARQVAYVAMGVVLNKDDSWLSLIDQPVGSAFRRDPTSGAFVPAAYPKDHE